MRSFAVRFTAPARSDINRLFDFLSERDLDAAIAAMAAIEGAIELLRHSPLCCRRASGRSASVRELVIPFGHAGYVALFEIEDARTVTVLALRHQREDDYR